MEWLFFETMCVSCWKFGCEEGHVRPQHRGIAQRNLIGIKSCRNSSAELTKAATVPALNVVYQDSSRSYFERMQYYHLLGVNSQAFDKVREIYPRWDFASGVLFMNEQAQHAPAEKIESVITYFMRWRDFSETRWAGAAPAARLFLSSQGAGLTGLVDLVYSTQNLSSYHMGGYREMNILHLQYLVVCAIGMAPIESCELALLEDDRFIFWWQETFGQSSSPTASMLRSCRVPFGMILLSPQSECLVQSCAI